MKNHHEVATPPVRRRDWRRIHHSPVFWVGAILFVAAISIFIGTDYLSWRPAFF